MAVLHRFTLKHNGRDSRWDLKDQTGEIIRTFQRKREATAGGVLERAVGKRAAPFASTNGMASSKKSEPIPARAIHVARRAR
jgi:hypothetical protein